MIAFNRLLQAAGILLLIQPLPALLAQTTIWSENFNNGCASNCLASTWNGWTIQDNVDGTTGGSPNHWYISCAEDGQAPPNCGGSCIGDATLHLGANAGAGGDMGASTNDTGATNATYKRVVSATISTVGYTNLTLKFDYFAFGSATCSDDHAELHLSTDDGATWPAGYQYCLNTVCCGACNGYSQGQWTLYSLALPAAFENNPNVRVAFHWQNNGNGSTTDPSVAIDDIILETALALPLTLNSFAGQHQKNGINLFWETSSEVNMSHFEVEKAANGHDFVRIGTLQAKGNGQSGLHSYQFADYQVSGPESFYRLKMVEHNGHMAYSNTIGIQTPPSGGSQLSLHGLQVENNTLNFSLLCAKSDWATVHIYAPDGKLCFQQGNIALQQGKTPVSLPVNRLAKGIYIIKVYTPEAVVLQKFIR